MPNNTPVWDAAVGGTHTLLLADGTNCMPDVYYLGKQPRYYTSYMRIMQSLREMEPFYMLAPVTIYSCGTSICSFFSLSSGESQPSNYVSRNAHLNSPNKKNPYFHIHVVDHYCQMCCKCFFSSAFISLQELRASNSTPTPESPLRDGSDKSKKRPMSSSISKSPTVKYAARAKQPEKLAFLKKVTLKGMGNFVSDSEKKSWI